MKRIWKIITTITLTALVLAGCGTSGNAEAEPETTAVGTEAAGETAETPVAAKENASGDLAPDPTNLTYLEEYQIKDILGEGKEYALYAPKGGQVVEERFFYFEDHGVTFTASAFPGGSQENLQKYLEDEVDMAVEIWQEDPECSDVAMGELVEKGNDRYVILTTEDKDYWGTPCQRTKLYYMSVRDGGVGVFWEMEVRENVQDEETSPLIGEVARCYGLDLSELAMEDGTWAEQSAQHETEIQDVYEPREGEPVLEKVEGYQYLGRLTLTFDEEEGITGPVLVPMGNSTSASEKRVSTTIHGVSVRAGVDYTYKDFQEKAQEEADKDLENCSNPEKGNKNVQISDVMPMQGEEQGVFYVLEYEEQDYRSEEYYERADITFMIHVEEQYFVNYSISLMSVDYDGATNNLIKELEKAYGLDLSEWYAKEV